MRLLFVYMVLFLLFLIARSGMVKEMLPGEASVKIAENEKSSLLEFDAKANTVKVYFSIMHAMSLVKQNDFAGGEGDNWNVLSGKLLYSEQAFPLMGQIQACYYSELMYLLSVRYIKGFYIYSLEKLII